MMEYRNLGRMIWIATIVITLVGLVTIYSATAHNVRVSQSVFFQQLICALVGFVIMFLLSHFDYRKFYDIAYVFYGISIFLLIAVLILGRDILGAKRWIEIGFFNFQPSELAKLAVIFALGRYFSGQRPAHDFDIRGRKEVLWRDLFFPFLLTVIPALFVFKQPDLGTAILIFGIFLVMLFVSEIEYRYFFSFVVGCLVLLPFLWHFLKPYQKDRLLVFLNPNIDPLGAGYTIIQSKIAIGSGRLFGKGWQAGTQNQLNFLPERHTDFIFSVIGEEWGLLGTSFLTACFFILIICCFNVAQQTKDKFGMMVAMGMVTILTLQVVINIGMVLGLFPIVGIPLPLVSYGRSSFLMFVFILGFLLNLSKRRSVF